jgi:hypothetical protein
MMTMFAPNQGFNPVGERQLVLTLAAGLTREQPAHAPRPWFRRLTRRAATVHIPVEAEPVTSGGEQFAPTKS